MAYFYKIEGTGFELAPWIPLTLSGKPGEYKITAGEGEHANVFEVPKETEALVFCQIRPGKILNFDCVLLIILSCVQRKTYTLVPLDLPKHMKQSSLTVLIIYGWDNYLQLPSDDPNALAGQSEDTVEAFTVAKEIIDNSVKNDIFQYRVNGELDIQDYMKAITWTLSPKIIEFDPYRKEELKRVEPKRRPEGEATALAAKRVSLD